MKKVLISVHKHLQRNANNDIYKLFFYNVINNNVVWLYGLL